MALNLCVHINCEDVYTIFSRNKKTAKQLVPMPTMSVALRIATSIKIKKDLLAHKYFQKERYILSRDKAKHGVL